MWRWCVMVVVALMAHPVSASDQDFLLNDADRQEEVLEYQQQPETLKNFIVLLAQVSELEKEKMREELGDLNRTIIQHIRISEGERETQQQLLSSMNTTLVSLVAMMESNKDEQKQVLSSLNNTVTVQGRQSEMERDMILEVLGTLNGTIQQHIHMSEGEREKQQQLLTSLNTTLVSHVAMMESNKDEQKQVLSSLNNTVTVQCQQSEQLRDALATLNVSIINQECYEKQEGYILPNNDCSISECHQGYLHPYQGARAANVSFSDLLAKNCVHLDRTNRNWGDARANCVALGGDLFVAGDLPGALKYIGEQIRYRGIWAGMRARAWSDGRTVTQQEWYPGHPSGGPKTCGSVYYSDVENNGVVDYTCTNTLPSLCQKGVRYVH